MGRKIGVNYWVKCHRRKPVADPLGVRRAVADHLKANADAGLPPPAGEDAAAALGLALEAWWRWVNNCRWFDFYDRRRGRCGWYLTRDGLAEAFGQPAAEPVQKRPRRAA